MSNLTRRSLMRLTLAVAGGTAATYASASIKGLVPAAGAAETKTRLNTRCTSQITQSTGNVYWSENQDEEIPPSHSGSLWRASKHNVNDRRQLWSQSSSGTLRFGRPTWAKVGATWWGFVVVHRDANSEVWRFDLADPAFQPAVVARSTGWADLLLIEANGTHVYWADRTGVYRAPVYGGAAERFAAWTGVTGLQLDQTYLYCVLDGLTIARLSLAGGSASLIYSSTAAAAPPIGSLRVKNGWMVWSDRSGAVKKRPAAGGVTQVLQPSSEGPVTVDFDGINAVYTYQYRHWQGAWMYQIFSKAAGRATVSTRLFAPASAVLSDATGFNWVEDGSLWRLTY